MAIRDKQPSGHPVRGHGSGLATHDSRRHDRLRDHGGCDRAGDDAAEPTRTRRSLGVRVGRDSASRPPLTWTTVRPIPRLVKRSPARALALADFPGGHEGPHGWSRMMSELEPREEARIKRRDRDAQAGQRAPMRTGLAKGLRQVLDAQAKRGRAAADSIRRRQHDSGDRGRSAASISTDGPCPCPILHASDTAPPFLRIRCSGVGCPQPARGRSNRRSVVQDRWPRRASNCPADGLRASTRSGRCPARRRSRYH